MMQLHINRALREKRKYLLLSPQSTTSSFSSSTEGLLLPVPVPKSCLIAFFSMIIIFFVFITKPFVNPSNAKTVSLFNRWLSLLVPTSLSFFSSSHEPPSSTLSKYFNIFDFLNLSKNPRSMWAEGMKYKYTNALLFVKYTYSVLTSVSLPIN
ncbi:hypothetical protein QQP08_004795 [Theobroma cacao]|nr:hypothetical protein QQP08_004795 [Theobroma cacao]